MQRRLRGEDFADSYGLMGGSGPKLEICKKYKLEQGWIRGLSSEIEPIYYLQPEYELEDRDGWREYNPFQDHPDLFLEFARLREKERSNQAQSNQIALDWANEYGLLGCRLGFYQDRQIISFQAAAPYEFVDEFFEEVDRAAAVLALYEAVLNRDEAAVWPLVQQFPDVVSDHWVRYLSTDAGSYYGGTLGFALTFVALEVMRMVRTFTYPKLTLLPGPALPSRLSSGHGFLNLLGVMYLQMYWLLAAGEKHVTRCKYCGKLVRLTARKPGNEGENRDRKPRQDKRYCNDACRQRHHYQTRTKPRRERERSQER